MKRLPIFITAFALFCSVTQAQELKLREDNIDQIVAAMTLEEKAHLVVGADMKKIDFAGEVCHPASLGVDAADRHDEQGKREAQTVDDDRINCVQHVFSPFSPSVP